jgi:hypothetical protein
MGAARAHEAEDAEQNKQNSEADGELCHDGQTP